MNKLTYIKLSHQEANRKIWSVLMDGYQSLKSKSVILGYLWFLFACIIFGLVAVFGWFTYLTLLLKDVRFTPHYLRTSIKYNNMTNEQAVKYLDTQKQKYISSLAFGNISNKKKNRIDACFVILYNDYQQPEVTKQEVVINQLNDIQTTVKETHTEVQYISGYTRQTEQKEKVLEEERERLKQKQQENKQKRKRINSKNPKHFESSLNNEQSELVTECCNRIKVFNKTITTTELENIFLCNRKEPLQTTNARLLSLLLANLKSAGYIHAEWQSIAANNVCFMSSYGNDMKSKKDFSTAASASTSVKPELEDIIQEYIRKIKKLDE